MPVFIFILSFLSGLSFSVVAETPQRIVSLAPNITEIIYALRHGDELVGITAADNYPTATVRVAKIGSFDQPSLELIVALRPTLVLTCGFKSHPLYARLRQLGTVVWDYDMMKLIDLYAAIDDIGYRLGYSVAQSRSLQSRMTTLQTRAATFRKLKVALIFWDDPVLTVGANSYLNDVMVAAGCENVFLSTQRSYFQTDPEQIMARKPDVILLLMMGKSAPQFIQSPFFKSYRQHHSVQIVDSIDPDLLLRAGPRLADGVEKLQQVLRR